MGSRVIEGVMGRMKNRSKMNNKTMSKMNNKVEKTIGSRMSRLMEGLVSRLWKCKMMMTKGKNLGSRVMEEVMSRMKKSKVLMMTKKMRIMADKVMGGAVRAGEE